MGATVLVAVEDSAAAFAAARVALELATSTRRGLAAVHVGRDQEQAWATSPTAAEDVVRRRAESGQAALKHVEAMCRRAGVPVRTVMARGAVAAGILAEARQCDADLIVIARANRRGLGLPYIGAEAQQVLEFAEVPVVVVPPP